MATILLVEDDPLEAHMIMPLLEREFGDVRRAADAAEALGVIEHSDFANEIGLVVSGQLLKGLRKPEFVAELHERMPELPVLVLGTVDESPGDYVGDHVAFLPRALAGREMVSLANKLLARHRNTVA
jgi:DNA-binding NtrC family response regulator